MRNMKIWETRVVGSHGEMILDEYSNWFLKSRSTIFYEIIILRIISNLTFMDTQPLVKSCDARMGRTGKVKNRKWEKQGVRDEWYSEERPHVFKFNLKSQPLIIIQWLEFNPLISQARGFLLWEMRGLSHNPWINLNCSRWNLYLCGLSFLDYSSFPFHMPDLPFVNSLLRRKNKKKPTTKRLCIHRSKI